jgi:Mce-associated membrane protein
VEPARHQHHEHALVTRVLVVVVLAAAVTTALLQWRQADRLTTRENTRQQVGTRAGEFGQALLSYRHTDPDAARKRVLSLATDDFGRTYDEAFTDGLQGVITKLKADATATVRTVYVDTVSGDDAKAIVVMDSEVKSTAGTRRVLGSYLEMELVRQKGGWRVKSVNSIGAVNESLTKPDGSTPATSPLPS